MLKTVPISGKKLAELREGLFLTQGELGNHMGLTSGSVSRLERQGVARVTVQNFRRLADFLKKTPDQLRGEIGADAAPEQENDQTSASGIADAYRIEGMMARVLTTKAALRGKRPIDFLYTLLNQPDEKLDRALPPGFRVPSVAHGGMRVAAKDAEEDEGAGETSKKPKGK